MRQRRPRVRSERHLAFIRSLPCCIPRCTNPDCEAAHIRGGSPAHAKRSTGIAEKPDDCWTVPLCREHHDEQHRGSEYEFWKRYGVDPLALALILAGCSGDHDSGYGAVRMTRWGRPDLAALPF